MISHAEKIAWFRTKILKVWQQRHSWKSSPVVLTVQDVNEWKMPLWFLPTARRNTLPDRMHSHRGAGLQRRRLWVAVHSPTETPQLFWNCAASGSNPASCPSFPDNAAGQGFNHLEFKIVVEPPDSPPFSVVLLAPSRQEKAAWTSDISQVGLTVGRLLAPGVAYACTGLISSALRCSALTISDVTAWWPACLRRTPKSLCHTWSSKQGCD